MRRLGFVGVLCVVGCGPLIPVPMDDGTTTTGPTPDDDSDDDDSTTATTVTTASATVLPSTSTPMTTPVTLTAPSTMTTGPIDGCVDLELLGGPVGSGLTSGTTIGATDDFQFCDAGGGGVTTGGGGVSGGDYVVSWIAPASGLYNFTLAGSNYDTVLGLFPPECGGDPYECNDDCDGVASSLESYVNAGQEVYIVIDGFQGQEGNFVLNIGTGPTDCSSGSGSGGNESADFISTAGE
jgi:hypothetical protein